MLLAEMPQMLREMLTRLIQVEGDLEPFDENGGRSEVLAKVLELQPDVLLLGSGEGDLADFEPRLFRAQPWLKILAIEPSGRRLFLRQLQPQRTQIGEASPERLIELIRSTASSGF